MGQKFLHIIFYLGALLFAIGTAFFWKNTCSAQTPYYGPTSPVAGLIKVEIQVYDDPDLNGVKVEEVIFDGKNIPLKPVGIHGFRGGGNFQVKAGSHLLIWRISKGSKAPWPRVVQHQQKVEIREGNDWVQITIQGEQATIV
jgi:hypothetical protein